MAPANELRGRKGRMEIGANQRLAQIVDRRPIVTLHDFGARGTQGPGIPQ